MIEERISEEDMTGLEKAIYAAAFVGAIHRWGAYAVEREKLGETSPTLPQQIDLAAQSAESMVHAYRARQ